MTKLAIHGGEALRTKPFPSWPVSTAADEKALTDTYRSAAWGADGEKNRAFRETFAKYAGVEYCIPVANGTVSIELILRALGIGRGDEIIVPAYTFIASISALIYAGVRPVFADIDKETFLLSPVSAEKAITPRTKAIMPVYVGGRPADLHAFEAICRKHNLYLIGDAAQAVGSEYDGKGIGNYGVATSISCQNSKNLNCGEGGLVLTNNADVYAHIMQILNGGRDKDGRYRFVGLSNGMSEFQASILSTQLSSLPAQIDKRMENAAYLNARLTELGFAYPLKADPLITRNSYHLFLFGLHKDCFADIPRSRFLEAVEAEGLPLACGYAPVYTFPCMTSEYTERCIGSTIDVKPDTPITDTVSGHEGCWLYHSILLGNREDMDDIIRILIKVYENLDELRR